MNKDYKIIFVDIDWTIFDHSIRPSQFDMDSINYLSRLQKEGVKVFICTARPYHSVEQIKLLDIFKPDGMILANGGQVVIDDESIYVDGMKEEEFEKICEIALSMNLNLEGVREKDAFLIAPICKEVEYVFETYPEIVPPVLDYHHQKVLSCTIFAYKDLDEQIINKLPKDLLNFRYHDYALEITTSAHIKGEGIKRVLDLLKIKKEEAIAIGDDIVDISMFENVGVGIAMGNGKDEVKESAHIITETVTKKGVYHALRKLFTIR